MQEASFSRLEDGTWGVAVNSEHGEPVDGLTGQPTRVTTRNGRVEQIVLGELVFSGTNRGTGQRFAKYRKGRNGRLAPPAPAAVEATPAEADSQSQTLEALRYLSDRCDGARTLDNQGFNGFDSQFGKDLAQRNRLTPGEERAALKMLRKYRTQLAGGGFSIDEMIAGQVPQRQGGAPQGRAPAPAPPERRVELEGDRLLLIFPYDADMVDAVRQLPDRRYDKDRKIWHLPVERCLEVAEFADKHGFALHQDARAAMNNQRALAEEQREAEHAVIAASKAADSDIELPVEGLFPFQRAGVEYVLNRRRTFLADEMGLGKTVQALAALEADNGFPALVVCPKSVKSVWRREAERWLPHRSVNVLEPWQQMLLPADITIVNYDIVFRLVDVLWNQFCNLVLDESHNVKNRKAQRTQAIVDIAKSLGSEDPMILCLSGTPLVNRPAELITQLNIMRRLNDLGGWKRYWGRYCGHDQRGAFHLNELNVELRKTCMVRRLKADVLTELPPRTFADVPVDIDNRAEYRYAETRFLAWVRETGGNVAAAQRAEQLVQMNALRVLAGRGKLQAAIDWIREFLESDGKLVVFAEHKDVQQEVFGALSDFNPRRLFAEDSDFEREQAVREFQEDESVRVIVLGLRVGGEGITLTAASNACFIELGWTPKSMLQAVDRCHRIGQRDAVTGWQLVAPKTIDDYMAEILAEKRQIMDQTLDGKAAADVGDQSIMNEVTRRMLAGESGEKDEERERLERQMDKELAEALEVEALEVETGEE